MGAPQRHRFAPRSLGAKRRPLTKTTPGLLLAPPPAAVALRKSAASCRLGGLRGGRHERQVWRGEAGSRLRSKSPTSPLGGQTVITSKKEGSEPKGQEFKLSEPNKT